MTRAAIYARFSSDLQKDTSIENQMRNCGQYAQRQGWTVTHRYEDKAISGSADEQGRPGYRRLLADAKGHQFEVILVDDLSRLSRDEEELLRARKRLRFWQVRLIGVCDGFDSAAKGHKIQATVRGLINEMYLDNLRDKVREGLTGAALKGQNCGGRAYGYKHVPILDPSEHDQYGRPKQVGARREIDPEQARWIRQIFTWYAGGCSPRWIAGELNRLGVPSPGAQYKRKRRSARPGFWSRAVLQGPHRENAGLLNNRLYIGQLIWNRREWTTDPDTNKARLRLRPKEEWVITEVPHLRIIEPALWERVQAQHRVRGQERSGAGQAHCGRGPKYLLSGLLKCGTCGGNYVIASSYQYGCHSHLNGSTSACTNTIRVARSLVEEKILEGLKKDLFSTEWLELFVKETTKLLAERARQRRPDLERTQRRLTEVEQQIARMVTAIKDGFRSETLKTELEQAEGERVRLLDAIRNSTTKADKVVTMLPRVKERYQALVANLANVTLSHVAEARAQIKDLLGEIVLKPTPQGFLEATLVGRFAGVAKLAVGLRLNNAISPRVN